jgi:arylsulfatase A-like enzyme
MFDRLYRKFFVNIFKKSYQATERSIKIVKRLLQKYKTKQPLFIFMNLMDTHWQYNPPKNYHNIVKIDEKEMQQLMTFDPFYYYIQGITDYQKEKLTLLYEQELYFLDDRLFDLYRSLDEIGVKDQTLFAITSDHGEFLGEHDLWGHYFSLYNELVHIPLVVKFPAAVGLKGESTHPVQLHDLYATIMELAGVPIPPPESSQSMLSDVREFAFAEHLNTSLGIAACRRRADDFQVKPFMQPCRCVIDRDLHKLIQWADGRQELYDIKADYAEASNLINLEEYQGRVKHLQQVMEDNLGAFEVPDKNASAKPDEHF